MSAKCFVDTKILFYAHDRQAGPKHDRAKRLLIELLGSDAGVLSTQVLQEFCVNLRRKGNLAADETRRLIQDFLGWEIVVNTPESVLGALGLSRGTTFPFGTRSSFMRHKQPEPRFFIRRISTTDRCLARFAL